MVGKGVAHRTGEQVTRTESFSGFTLTAERVSDTDSDGEPYYATRVSITETIVDEVADGQTGESEALVADVFIDETGHGDVFWEEGIPFHACGPGDIENVMRAIQHAWCLHHQLMSETEEPVEKAEKHNVN